MSGRYRAWTPTLLAAFFAFAALMCTFAAVTLLAPGGTLDALWRIKADEHRELLAMGSVIGVAFSLLAVAMTVTAYGTARRRRWGWRLAILIFIVNAFGDALRIAQGAVIEGLLGVMAAGLILWWLTRPQVRASFTQ
jgi:membrane-bound metal-dependent hydrolase YbcI (DUF457 family)